MGIFLLKNRNLILFLTLISFTFLTTKANSYTWQEDLVNLSVKIRENELELEKLEEYKLVLQLKNTQNQKNLEKAQENMLNSITSIYKLSLSPVQSFLLGKKSSNEIALTYSLFNYFVKYFTEEFNKNKEYLAIIKETEHDFNNIQSQIERINDQLRKSYADLKIYIKNNQKQQISQIKQQGVKLNKEVTNLTNLMNQINKSYYLLPEEKEEGKKFIKNKGSLVLPVAGFIESKFHSLKKNNIYYNGIQILALPSSQIVSPFDGEIIFNEEFLDYNRIIIIKHAPFYFSIISGQYDSFVQTTQLVKKHEPIGISTKKISPIYFELEYQSNPVNPLDWVSNKK